MINTACPLCSEELKNHDEAKIDKCIWRFVREANKCVDQFLRELEELDII